MKSILLAHAHRYPKMEPRDAVKLLYQNEFGGGHLIKDESACLEYLRKEYESVSRNPDLPLLEDIGNGIVRVNLAALNANHGPLAELGHAFIRSAAIHKGSVDSFLKKLALLKELAAAGAMPFSPAQLESYLADYKKAGFPPVSHSEIYRSLYRPAYRVVRKDLLPDSLLERML